MRKRHRANSITKVAFESLFDDMPHLGWICNADGSMHQYNSCWFEFTGTTHEQLQESGWRIVHDPDLFPKIHSRFLKSLKAGNAFEMDFPLKRHDGCFERFLTKVAPLTVGKNQNSKWIGISTNIQTLVENHETVKKQFVTMANALPNMVWRADRDLNVNFFNQRWYEYTGATPDQSFGQGWREWFSEETHERMEVDWERAIREKAPYVGEQFIRSKNGDFRWFLTRSYPLLDDNGDILSWFGTNTDIDQQKRSAELLEQQVAERTHQIKIERDKAIAADLAKSNFLAVMSHEVRTPLAGVIGLVELLSDTAKGSEDQIIATDAFNASKRLMSILDDLLHASKLQAGQVEIESRQFNLRHLIAEVVALLKSAADKKALIIKSEVAESLPVFVRGDELRLRQILSNFVSNAIKFTDVGSVEINCKVKKSDRDKVVALLEVSDSGIGIAADKIGLLFQPFSQLEQSTTRIYGGTGLGLSICKNLVELMDGQIGVESESGSGSKFWVEIPFDKVG